MTTAARITPQGKGYVEWVTGLDTEPSLEGAFVCGWHARDAECERLRALLERMLRTDDAVQIAWGNHIRKALRP